MTQPISPHPSMARILREAVRRLVLAHGALNEVRRPCGTPLPTPHAWALLELQACGPMTITALALRLNIDRTNVSRLCIKMESLGELKRIPHPSDKRSRLVELTPKGTQLAHDVDASSTEHFERVLEHLDNDPAVTLKTLTALTHAMAPALMRDLETYSPEEP
ncbi:MAG: MarR family winged helix-turn-helix transcriptional regulator [Myxococcota bacterium]